VVPVTINLVKTPRCDLNRLLQAVCRVVKIVQSRAKRLDK
jgi:hypothetical protein